MNHDTRVEAKFAVWKITKADYRHMSILLLSNQNSQVVYTQCLLALPGKCGKLNNFFKKGKVIIIQDSLKHTRLALNSRCHSPMLPGLHRHQTPMLLGLQASAITPVHNFYTKDKSLPTSPFIPSPHMLLFT